MGVGCSGGWVKVYSPIACAVGPFRSILWLLNSTAFRVRARARVAVAVGVGVRVRVRVSSTTFQPRPPLMAKPASTPG